MRLTVNGVSHEFDVDPDVALLHVLRDTFGLKSVKLGCGLEQCGACAVLVDGVSTLSCSTPVAAFDGCDIVTCEGLGTSAALSQVQQAFAQVGAGQCGYCIPGLVVATTGLLNTYRNPDDVQISEATASWMSRCCACIACPKREPSAKATVSDWTPSHSLT